MSFPNMGGKCNLSFPTRGDRNRIVSHFQMGGTCNRSFPTMDDRNIMSISTTGVKYIRYFVFSNFV